MDSATTQTTTTVTRTTRVSESAEIQEMRTNLRTIAGGLEEVREKARAEMEAIDNLIGLLDVDALGGVVSMIEELETRITTVNKQLSDFRADSAANAEELEAEKQRLTKLWDAYKTQEEELRRARRDEPILKEKLADRERLISEMEDEIARYKSMESYKDRYHALMRDHERMRESYKQMESDLEQRNEIVAQLEARAESFKQVEDKTRRVNELERQLSEEKERLAKLYKVYEDTETRLRDLEDEAARWRQWYDRHRQAFEMVGDAAHYPVNVTGQRE